MGLSRKGNNRPKPSMNVTPLVDVVLVLLIIFMVVLPALEESVRVALPTVDNADEQNDDTGEPFTLSIVANGTYFFDTVPVQTEQFEALLRERHEAQPRRRIMLRADATVPYVRVRTMMHMCREIGFPGVSLRVNERQDDGQSAAAPRTSEGALALR